MVEIRTRILGIAPYDGMRTAMENAAQAGLVTLGGRGRRRSGRSHEKFSPFECAVVGTVRI